MRLQSAIILVKDVSPTKTRTELGITEAQCDEAARLILETAGVINPLILLRTGVTAYTIIDGHFEYYAALRARELDPRRGETINAYIAESESAVEIFKKQVKLFRKPTQPTATANAVPVSIQVCDSLPILKSLSNEMTELKEMFGKMVKTLENQVSQMTKMLEESSRPVAKPRSLPVPIVSADREEIEKQFLSDVNTLPIDELLAKLKKAGATKNVVDNVKKEREKLPFQSVVSIEKFIKRIKGLAQKTMDKILNQWS
ncbi:MAG: hypothetical protein BWK79_03505 [Beggiatoa sp. IS2]|nr:MAG: hypothetical protein BWK79_03505 [Beggiatoa sp. IS2]